MKHIGPNVSLYTILMVFGCIFISCSNNPNNNHPHPGANMIGTYQMNCTCDDLTTGPLEATPKSYQMTIGEISGDTVNLEILNLDNAGVSRVVQILTANSFKNDTDFIQGSLYQNTLTVSYIRYPNNCDGTGTKQ